MSILVKGMEMPKSCLECVCKHKFFSDMKCYEFPDFEFDGTEKFPHAEDRSLYCPLVPVPPHGRLIDADELKKHKYHDNDRFENAVSVAQIDWADTIIEADKGAEE